MSLLYKHLDRRILFISLCFISFLLINSCKKIDHTTETILPAKFDIAAAKEWWYGTFRKSPAFKELDKNSPWTTLTGKTSSYTKDLTTTLPDDPKTLKMPYWDRGISYSIGKTEVAEFPLKYQVKTVIYPGSDKHSYEEKTKVAEAAINRLLIFNLPGGKTEVRVVSLIPSLGYAYKKGYDISSNKILPPDADFEGWQVIRRWDESLIGIWKIENGKRVQKVLLKEKEGKRSTIAAANINLVNAQLVCEYDLVEKEVEICVGYLQSGDVPPNPNEDQCALWSVTTVQVYEYTCEEVPEPCDGMDAAECLCQVYAVCDDGPGMGGGSTNVNQNIIDSLQNYPCAQGILAQLPNLNSKVKEIISSVFGLNDDFNLYFKVKDNYTKDSADGITRASFYTTGFFNAKIYLNPWVLNNSTKEYILVTMLHEGIHAYINYWFNQYKTNQIDSTVLKQKFPIFWQGGATPNLFELSQHNEIANNYINIMAGAIKSFNPQALDTVSIALAWGGLHKTTLWQTKSDSTNILNINWKARDASIVDTSYHLTKCN